MEYIKATKQEVNEYIKSLKGIVAYGSGNLYTEDYTVLTYDYGTTVHIYKNTGSGQLGMLIYKALVRG